MTRPRRGAADPERRATVSTVTARLAAAGVRSPETDARWLVDHVDELAGEEPDRREVLLGSLVARRASREPVQLVIGRTWFRHLELLCAPGVFIPRPETEVVAQVAIDLARGSGDAPVVVDVGTGTGAIGLSVAVEVPGAQITAAEIDDTALALARRNLERLGRGEAGAELAPGSRVEIVGSDLLAGLDPVLAGSVDVLVANPPYLPASDRGELEPEVADHDPDRALVGGPDGHEVVDALIAAAPTWLRPGGSVVLEIDERRGGNALAVVRAAGLVDGRVVADLTGADRVVIGTRPRR